MKVERSYRSRREVRDWGFETIHENLNPMPFRLTQKPTSSRSTEAFFFASKATFFLFWPADTKPPPDFEKEENPVFVRFGCSSPSGTSTSSLERRYGID